MGRDSPVPHRALLLAMPIQQGREAMPARPAVKGTGRDVSRGRSAEQESQWARSESALIEWWS